MEIIDKNVCPDGGLFAIAVPVEKKTPTNTYKMICCGFLFSSPSMKNTSHPAA